ncbi:MAG: ankyrin repeat domain-containing protein [Eubacterium sp.]|nr:ankyrin repeat domain-containing protein [Eubacterium sp.]
MNVEKADYGTIIKFGTMHDFNMKLQMEGKMLDEVINITDKDGISLLERSLIARKFDIAKELLANNAEVNNISDEGCNELHYIASNINYDGALDIAKILLDRGTSLLVKEKKYGNSAFFTLCQEIFKIRSVEGLNFIETCFENIQEYDSCNKMGYSIRMLINERGTDRLKQMMESRI